MAEQIANHEFHYRKAWREMQPIFYLFFAVWGIGVGTILEFPHQGSDGLS